MKAEATVTQERKCRNCGEIKSTSEFHKNPGWKDGLNCNCKRCCNEKWIRPYTAAHRDKYRENAAKWRKENPEKYDAINRRARERREAKRADEFSEYLRCGLKRCSKCKIEKPFSEFHRLRTARDGLTSPCKACAREYGQATREQKSAVMRRWRAANPDKALAASRRSLAKHRKKRLATTRDWRARNPEKLRASYAKWRKANPDKVRVKHVTRRARKYGATGKHTAAEKHALLEAQLFLCANPFCHTDLRSLRSHDRNLDHVVPLANGGANDIKNAQWLCRPCNLRKGTYTQAEWLRREAERTQEMPLAA